MNFFSASQNIILRCSIEPDGTEICQVFCDDGFSFAESTKTQFSCANGKWSPEINLPDCVDKSIIENGGFLNKTSIFYPENFIDKDQKSNCLLWQNKHYKTFDGLMYTFKGLPLFLGFSNITLLFRRLYVQTCW